MIRRTMGWSSSCAGADGGRVALQAHHSLAGVYDMKGEKEVTGTLTIIQFVNPHGSMHIDVKNADGTTTEWTFTTGSATTLARTGDRQELGRPQGRRRHHREIHPDAGRQSAGVPQVDHQGRRDGDHDLGRQPQ